MKAKEFFFKKYSRLDDEFSGNTMIEFAEAYAEQEIQFLKGKVLRVSGVAFELQKENIQLKALLQELFSYYPNTRGYDDVRKELLKTIR